MTACVLAAMVAVLDLAGPWLAGRLRAARAEELAWRRAVEDSRAGR